MLEDRVLGVGLVGAGNWGQKLARAFERVGRAEVRVICDVSEAARDRAAEMLPDAQITHRFDDALDRSDVRAIVIATPPASHASLALKAVRAGQDVFLEKPMALSLGEAVELERVAHESERRVMVGHILEYHPAMRELRRRIARGELGDIQLIVSRRLGPSPRPDESPWWSLAPHDVSAIRYLLAREVVRVAAGRLDASSACARLDCAGGPTALVELGLAHPEKIRRIVVAGSERVAVFDDVAHQKLMFFDVEGGERTRIAELGARAREFSPAKAALSEPLDGFSPEHWMPRSTGETIAIEAREPLLAEVSHFVDAVLDRAPIDSDAASGRLVTAALEAGDRSIASGGEAHAVS